MDMSSGSGNGKYSAGLAAVKKQPGLEELDWR